MMILGVATIDENTPPDGSVIAAFDSDGNCAGAAELIVQGGSSYIQLPIYPDDSTTPSIDEGMNSGENFTIELWDGANINDHDTEYDCWVSNNGAPMNGCLSDYTQEVPFTSSGSGGADDWPEYAYPFDDFTPGPASMAFLGIATINGGASSSGDIIAAFDQDGTPAGAGELVVNGGTGYISFTIYGDDSATEEDEGIGAGDDFYLTLYDASENMTITYMQTFDCWANENGASHPGCGNEWDQVWNFTGSCGDDNVWCGGGLNNPPVANDQSVTTDEDVSLEIGLTGSDAEGDPLTFTIVDAPSYGSLGDLSSTGDYTSTVMYAPDEDFNGSDSFTF
ncbi:MAG TPA: hypothetical protein EYO07_06315, partial [Candidatus Marinimicrobia bacterium]|nr:hypothetical protein [Candidatus Neomarinimicrobiota bacterium]